jgi:hypothetical protein
MREFARVLEASRERGMTFIADYNAIGDGKDGVYRVRNRGDIRAIQREVAFVGWELTGNKHLKTVLMDLNAFRASAMKAINNGELGIFNNDMQVIEADLRTYLGNHRNGLPGEAGIGQAKRDMLNGLIGTGTAVQRKANPLFSDLNPRGSVRSFRLDRYNDLTPTGREGLPFDYDKINSNRMPQHPAFVVSANLKSVAAVGTPEARYILGDLSAEPDTAPKALPKPKQANTSSQEPAGMKLDDINRELDSFMMADKKLSAKDAARNRALLAEVEKRAGKGMTRLPPMPEFYGPRKELPR